MSMLEGADQLVPFHVRALLPLFSTAMHKTDDAHDTEPRAVPPLAVGADHEDPLHWRACPALSTAMQNVEDVHETELIAVLPSIFVGADQAKGGEAAPAEPDRPGISTSMAAMIPSAASACTHRMVPPPDDITTTLRDSRLLFRHLVARDSARLRIEGSKRVALSSAIETKLDSGSTTTRAVPAGGRLGSRRQRSRPDA
jgi:hypothetical protein